jgi:hypothetical protein
MAVVVQSRLLILGIFMLQLPGCSPQAFSYLRCSSHIRILVFSHHVADNLLYQTIHIVADDPAFGKHLRSRSSHSCSLINGLSLFPRAISSPCRYRYPPRSTEHIPLVPHPVVLQTMSIYHCRYSPFVAVISVSQVILSLSSCRCSPLLSSSTSTSQITASKPRRSSAPREGVLS